MIPKVFIVDDEAPARVRLKTLLSDIADECPHQYVGEADNAQAALDGIASLNPDIVLLDVQMPGMTGIELAANLTKQAVAGMSPAIIFVTAYDAFAVKAFEVHAVDYLLKPVRAARLSEAIRRATVVRASAQTRIAKAAADLQPARRHFTVQERDRVLLVPVSEVLYLKAELKYVTVRTRMRQYLIEESLMSIEQELSTEFIRVHRNALVARNAIIGVERGTPQDDADGESEKGAESWQVILRGIDDRLPISRRQWPAIKALVR
jgi:two-component system response regulator AlgR